MVQHGGLVVRGLGWVGHSTCGSAVMWPAFACEPTHRMRRCACAAARHHDKVMCARGHNSNLNFPTEHGLAVCNCSTQVHKHRVEVKAILGLNARDDQADVKNLHTCDWWLENPTAGGVLVWALTCHATAWSTKRFKSTQTLLWNKIRNRRIAGRTPVHKMRFKRVREVVRGVLLEQQGIEKKWKRLGWNVTKKDGLIRTAVCLKKLLEAVDCANMRRWCKAAATAMGNNTLGDAATCDKLLWDYKLPGRHRYMPCAVYGALCYHREPRVHTGGDELFDTGGGFEKALLKEVKDVSPTVSGFNSIIRVAYPEAEWLDWRAVSYLFCMMGEDVRGRFLQILKELKYERTVTMILSGEAQQQQHAATACD